VRHAAIFTLSLFIASLAVAAAPKSKATASAATETPFETLYPGFGALGGPQPLKRSHGDWGSSPEALFLATDEERKTWSSFKDEADKLAFADDFWKRRDPNPATPQNEWQRTFNQRASFADYTFGGKQLRGALSDRGRVFLLLGQPAKARVSKAEGGSRTETWIYADKSEFTFKVSPEGAATLQSDEKAAKRLTEAAKKPVL
jgi:GWxTD domain-containing protein